jgi:hypothetical protein
MWGLVRITLLAGNAVLFAWLASVMTGPDAQSWFALGMLAFLALNFVYLLLGNQLFNWHIFRLIGLWFDAKEGELRQRADRSRQDK